MSSAMIEPHPPLEELVEQHTPEELLARADGHRYELIDGKLVERQMGAVSSAIALNIMSLVNYHVHAHKKGLTFATDCGYQIFPDDPKKVRFPDGSYIEAGRLPENKAPKGYIRIAPDLALEVVSPHDTAEEIEARRLDFMQAGTRLFWVIYPETRTVHVYRQNGSVAVLTPADELSGEDVLPGFACRVADLFEGL